MLLRNFSCFLLHHNPLPYRHSFFASHTSSLLSLGSVYFFLIYPQHQASSFSPTSSSHLTLLKAYLPVDLFSSPCSCIRRPPTINPPSRLANLLVIYPSGTFISLSSAVINILTLSESDPITILLRSNVSSIEHDFCLLPLSHTLGWSNFSRLQSR